MLGSSSCKVNYSFTGASISPEIQTISIDFFETRAPLAPPITSQLFTETLKSTFLTQTSLRMVGEQGDLQFSGTITSYVSTPAAIQGDNSAALNMLTISVKVNFINQKDPSQNFEKIFSNFKNYNSSSNLVDIEEQLISEISDLISQNIFNDSVSNW